MGWKAVRDHYNISHIVHVRGGKLMIGSPYVSEMIVVQPDGSLTTSRSVARGIGGEVERYLDDFTADPAKLVELFAVEDKFDASHRVYSAKGGKIVEQFCEHFDWPNVTHDGELMYENTHFKTYKDALENGLRNAHAYARSAQDNVTNQRQKLADAIAQQIESATELESYKELKAHLQE